MFDPASPRVLAGNGTEKARYKKPKGDSLENLYHPEWTQSAELREHVATASGP
jgi:hypothetical protein